MKKLALILVPIFTAAGLLLLPLAANALDLQSGFSSPSVQFDSYVTDTTADTTTDDSLGGVFGLMIMCLWCGIMVFTIATTVIWVLSLIDIVKRENWKNENDKIVWLLLVVFLNVASLYYYFFYRKKLDAQVAQSVPVTE